MRIVKAHPPDRTGLADGLAWTLFEPHVGRPPGGVVILHGAGSTKEHHHDFARACASGGLAALCFDMRGHGESAGELGTGAIDDVVAVANVLRGHLGGTAPIALRGSSMGGYLALVAARAADAAAVVAICPASARLLRDGLDAERFTFRAGSGLRELLADHDPVAAAATLDAPLLVMHARGDERVPIEDSRELVARAPHARLLEAPGGHHSSVQHDPELQGEAVRFLVRALRRRPSAGGQPT